MLEISGTGPVDWETDDDGSKTLYLPGGGFNPPDRRQRSSGQDQAAPYYNSTDFNCRVTTVRLPETTANDDWWYNTAFNRVMFGETFRRSFDKRDGSIRMVRSSRTLLNEIDAASAARDNARLASFDNSMARIEYRRAGTSPFQPPHSPRLTSATGSPTVRPASTRRKSWYGAAARERIKRRGCGERRRPPAPPYLAYLPPGRNSR